MAALVTMALVLEEEEEEQRRRQRRQRRYWVHPVIANRQQRGQFWVLYNDLRAHEEKFFEYTRMSMRRWVMLMLALEQLLIVTMNSL